MATLRPIAKPLADELPIATVAGVWPQPELAAPLQFRPSTTDTVPSNRFPT
jgi:hypothetical protein